MSHNFNITPILTTVLNMNKKTNTVTFISDNKRQVKDILFLFYNIIIRQNGKKKTLFYRDELYGVISRGPTVACKFSSGKPAVFSSNFAYGSESVK